MNDEIQPKTSTAETIASAQIKEPAPISVCDDDSDLNDVQLGPRQTSATQIIVCEGGCE